MFLNQLVKTYQENKRKNKFYLRNLLKQVIQAYVLKFVSGSRWNNQLVFKGGTALRFCFDLPRLSEDLDFDIERYGEFEIEKLVDDLKTYFIQELQYKDLKIKIAKNKRTVYLKFPVLKQIGAEVGGFETNVVHIRLDFAQAPNVDFKTEISTKLTLGLALVMRRYSLADLFAGKIAAIITREKIEGQKLVERFKGRDYFDLIWFLEKKIKPSWKMVEVQTGFDKKTAVLKLNEKASQITKEMLTEDLSPFIDDIAFVKNFSQNFLNLLKDNINYL